MLLSGEHKYIRYFFHLTGLLLFAYDIWFHAVHLPIPPGMEQARHFGGMFKYLTVWDLFVQCGYHLFSVICDIRPNQNPARRDVRLRDFLFVALAFPLSMFVAGTFWAIYSLDREMILPAAFRKIYPEWLNHLDHSVPAALMFLEAFLFPHALPSRKSGLTFLLSFAAGYLAWVLFLVWYAGIWVYPFLQVMSWLFRGAFIGGALLGFVFLYLLGEVVVKMSLGQPGKLSTTQRSIFLEDPISPGLRKTE